MTTQSFNPHIRPNHQRYAQIRDMLQKSPMNAPQLNDHMVVARSTLNSCLTFLTEQGAVTRSKSGRKAWMYVWNDEFDLSTIPVADRPPPHNKGKRSTWVPDTEPFRIPPPHPITVALFGCR